MTIYAEVREILWRNARIQINTGKTRIWNSGQHRPDDIDSLGPWVWRSDPLLPTEDQGLIILGTPLGHEDFIRGYLRSKYEIQQTLLHRTPTIPDLQSAWLLLLFCASTRATYVMRMIAPELADDYARDHDAAIWQCLCILLATNPAGIDAPWMMAGSLSLSNGGLGLRSARRGAPASFWASWADCLPQTVSRSIGRMLVHSSKSSCVQIRTKKRM